MTAKKKTVTDEQLGKIATKQWELFRRVKDGSLDPDSVEKSLQILLSGGKDFSQIKSQWEKFYKEVFGIKADFSQLSVPEADGVYSWLVINHPNVTLTDLHSGGKKPQPSWKHASKELDDIIDWKFGRDAIAQKQQYVVRFRANHEADEDMKNSSAKTIDAESINTITLKERLLLGRFLFWSEGIILDKNVITLCSGSRFTDGRVPFVRWHDDEVSVHWCIPDSANGGLRARRAVS